MDLTIDDVPAEVLEVFHRRARLVGVSLEEYLRQLLIDHADHEPPRPDR